MQHCHFVTPVGSARLPAVGPSTSLEAETKMFVALGGFGTRFGEDPVAHSGAGVGLFDNLFKSGTNPPPKLATFVKVCVSPPRFLSSSDRPLSTGPRRGSNRHAATK